MDLKQIHELIKIVNKSNIGEISIEDKDGKVTIKQKEDQVISMATPQQVYSIPQAPQQSVLSTVNTNQSAETTNIVTTQVVTTNTLTIKSPMIGTFYRKSGPDKPPFAEIGTEVEPGKVVCIIEAMKLFNEIESEVKGKIVKILVEDASPVEYDQPLFLVEPN
jgi:acetyl-CoA carboxylase biotin carboxyl carrier protein